VKTRFALVLAATVLTSCSGASLSPKGWQPVPGSQNAWSRGSGSSSEEYSYSRTTFSGALQDLASEVTIDALLHHPGSKLRGSNPLAPCPGAAGLATFSLPGDKAFQEGFAVRDGTALRAIYIRPAGVAADPNVAEAMQSLLC
jgi:hypothetical protein